MKKLITVFAFSLLSNTFSILASDTRDYGPLCFAEAAAEFNIDPLLLYSIAMAESKMKIDAINTNKDGTQDFGLMQINSSHLPRLRRAGITKTILLSDPCVNIMAGAAILSDFKRLYNGDEWHAVGAYNAGLRSNTAIKRKAYVNKVKEIYHSLTE
jgi:soluble lytic murein transglycosylase-like protein